MFYFYFFTAVTLFHLIHSTMRNTHFSLAGHLHSLALRLQAHVTIDSESQRKRVVHISVLLVWLTIFLSVSLSLSDNLSIHCFPTAHLRTHTH